MTDTQSAMHREKALLALYRPPAVLKTPHKNLLKTIWSFQQGFNGEKVRCFSCHNVFTFKQITVHHSDGNTHHNDFENLSPACWDCQGTEKWLVRRRQVAQRKEREKKAYAATQTLADIPLLSTSEETARSLLLRTKFNRVLYDPSDGLARQQGYNASVKGLSKIVVHMVGPVRGKLGTSQTFKKYLEEDLAGEIWNSNDVDDPDAIERTSKPFPFPEHRAQPG